MYKNSWKEWFLFTRRDRNAAFILLSVIALLLLLPYLLPAKKSVIHIDKALQEEFDQYTREHTQAAGQPAFAAAVDTAIGDSVNRALFFFDPNTLSDEGFSRLGLSPKTIHTLVNYRNKGGYFKTPGDIRKIYGLSKADADRLIPYVRIEPKTAKSTENKDAHREPATIPSSKQYRKTNVNTASAEEWKAFPGIGEVLANRIVKFRTSIGGFATIDQVGKTYGLSDSVFQSIKPYLYLQDSIKATP